MKKELRFYEIPVGTEFVWGNGFKYIKTKDVHSGEIYQDEMEPNCISLDNGHECVMSAIFKCHVDE